MARKRRKSESTDDSKAVVQRLDLIAKLLGVTASEKDFSEKSQPEQVNILARRGIRAKDIAGILGMKQPNVSRALKNSKK